MTAIVFLNSLGTDGALWDPQVVALGGRHPIVRHDVRRTEACTVADLAGDILARLDALGLERAHLVGLSMGGQIAQWLALSAPARVDRVVLASTAARIGTPESWDARIAAVRAHGLAPLADSVLERWLSAGFRARAPEAVAQVRAMLLRTPPEVYAACCAAIRDFDARAEVAAIRAPTLVLCGRADPATPPADGRFLTDRIPGARLVELDAAHLANIEAADDFTAAVTAFLGG